MQAFGFSCAGKKLLFPWTDFVERMTVKCSNFPTIVSQGTTCLPMNGSILAEIYLDELSESTGVIVVYCLRIAKSLKNKCAKMNICTICIVTMGIYNASYIPVMLLVYIDKFTFYLERKALFAFRVIDQIPQCFYTPCTIKSGIIANGHNGRCLSGQFSPIQAIE